MLTTRDAVRAVVPAAAAIEDAALDALIAQASDRIEAHCRRRFGPRDITETVLLPACHASLILGEAPVLSVTRVTEAGRELAESAYYVDKGPGVLHRLAGGAVTRWARGVVEVLYRAGFEEPPAAVAEACVRLVRAALDERGRNLMVKAEDIPGVMRTEYWVGGIGNGALPPDITAMLAGHRAAVLG